MPSSPHPSSPNMTIAHVITRFERAGSEENTTFTINHQAKTGHSCILICGSSPDKDMIAKLDERIEIIEVPDLVHHLSPLKDIACLRTLRRCFRNHRVTLVHTHQSKAGILGRLAARQAKVRHVLHTTHILAFLNVRLIKRFIYLTAERIAGRATDAFIHVSPAMEKACRQAGIGKTKIHRVIYSGMDLTRFQDAPLPNDFSKLRASLSASQDRQIVLYLSAFEPRKRQADFVRQFRDVVIRVPNVLLLLAGTGPEEQHVRGLIDELGLSDHVKMLGYRGDPEKLIALSDICVFASEREGLPRSVIQYVAGGKPIITTGLPGIEMLVQNRMNGYVVAVDDLHAMAPALIELLNDETLRLDMARRSAEMDLSQWEAETMVTEIDYLIEELVSSN